MASIGELKDTLSKVSKGKINDIDVLEEVIHEDLEDVEITPEGLKRNKILALEAAIGLLRCKNKIIIDVFKHISDNGSIILQDGATSFTKIPDTDVSFRFLDRGEWGDVFLLKRGASSETIVLKCIQMFEPDDIKKYSTEVYMMNKMSPYPGFINYYSHFIQGSKFYIFMEYFEGESLLSTVSKISQEQKISLFQRFCESHIKLHDEYIVRHDWNPANYLIDDKLDYRFIDFGWSFCFDGSDLCYKPRDMIPDWLLKSQGHMPNATDGCSFMDLKIGDFYNLYRGFMTFPEKMEFDKLYEKEKTSSKFKTEFPNYYKEFTGGELPANIAKDIELDKTGAMRKPKSKKRRKIKKRSKKRGKIKKGSKKKRKTRR
jgi:serine/threonine protein kinase